MNNNRRIAYIVSMGAGLETFIYREIEEMLSKDYLVFLFATRFKKNDVFSPKKGWEYYAFTIQQILIWLPVVIIKLLSRPSLLIEAYKDGGLIDLLFATRFSMIMKNKDMRQIHCHFGDRKFFIGYYCKRLTGLPLSVTIHAHEFYTNPNSVLFQKALNLADQIFPIAERWSELLQKDYSVPEHKITLNHLFVDTDLYAPSDEIRVLSVGRFTERKGFHHLIEAATLLKDLNIRFLFVGFGEQNLHQLVSKFGVSDQVTIFNKMDQPQLRALYQMADILCVPSITTDKEGAEGIPVVLMEGMACGLPVVTTPCGAIEEIVDDFIVEESSPEQLAAALRELAINPDLRVKQGLINRGIVQQHFSSNNVSKFAKGLDSIVNNSQ